MSPIEQVKPALPGNWVRRPEPKVRRPGGKNEERPGGGDAHRPDSGPGDSPGEREHIVDELA